MNNLPNEILEIIWSFDSTFHEEYKKKCINEINKLFENKNNLIISITDYINYQNRKDLNYIIKNKKKIINQKICNSLYKHRIINSDIKEYEIYYRNNEIKLVVYYIKYNNNYLLQKL